MPQSRRLAASRYAVSFVGLMSSLLVVPDIASAQPSETPTIAPPERPYFHDGDAFWEPIATDVRLDPDTAAIAGMLADPAADRVGDLYDFGVPIVVAGAGTPRHRLVITEGGTDGWGNNDLADHLVPIPVDAVPANGSDGKLVVIDPASNSVYDLWQLQRADSGWSVSWGGVYALDGTGSSENPAYQGPHAVEWPRPLTRGTGSGISSLAGVVRASEVAAGVIDHALVFSTDRACGPAQTGDFRWPATSTDGWVADGSLCIPQGARVQLDPTIDLEAIVGITAGELAVGRALQQYGAYAIDNGGARMAFIFEVPTGDGDDVYRAAGLDGDYAGLDSLPWDHLRLLASWNGA